MQDRHEKRHELTIEGKIHTGVGMPRGVLIGNLSRDGCRFHDEFGRLAVDAIINLRIGPFGPLDAKVRWRETRTVGVSFEPPLHESVMDHIREYLAETGGSAD